VTSAWMLPVSDPGGGRVDAEAPGGVVTLIGDKLDDAQMRAAAEALLERMAQ